MSDSGLDAIGSLKFYRNQKKWVLARGTHKKIENKTPTSRNLNETYNVEGEEATGFNDAFLESGPSAPTDMSEFETEEYPPENWSSAEEELLNLNDVHDLNLTNAEPEHSNKLPVYNKKSTPDLIKNYQVINNTTNFINFNVVNQMQDDNSEKLDQSTLEKFTKSRRIDMNNNKIIVHNDDANQTNSQLRNSFGDVRLNECLVDFKSYQHFLVLAQMEAGHETLDIPVGNPENYNEGYQYTATEAERRPNEGWSRETLPRVNNIHKSVVKQEHLYVHVDNPENCTEEYQYSATEPVRRPNEFWPRETLPRVNNICTPVVNQENLYVHVDNPEKDYQYTATEAKRSRNEGWPRETLPRVNNNRRPVESEDLWSQNGDLLGPDRSPQQTQAADLLQVIPLRPNIESARPEEGARMSKNVDNLDTQPQRPGSPQYRQEEGITAIKKTSDEEYQAYLDELLEPPPLFFLNIADSSLVEPLLCHQTEGLTEPATEPASDLLSQHLQNLRLAEMYVLEGLTGEDEDLNQDNAPALEEEPWLCDSVDSSTFMAGAGRAPHSSEIDLLALIQSSSHGDIPFWRLYPPPTLEEYPNRDFGTGLGKQAGLNASAAPFQPNIDPCLPNTTPFQPNTAPFQPNTAPFQSNTTNFQPNTAPFQPNIAPFQPNTTPFQSNPARFQTNTSPFLPNATPFQPNTTPFQSNTARFQPNAATFRPIQCNNAPFRPKSPRFCLTSRQPPGFNRDDVNTVGPRGDEMPFAGRGRGRLHRQ